MKSVQGQKPQHSAKFLRQRKFLVVLPVLVLPFLVLLLWTLGLVGEVKAEAEKKSPAQGLNLTLPAAAPAKDSNWNKMRYYEQADRDSARLRSYLKSDPYRRLELEVAEQAASTDPDDLSFREKTPAARKSRSLYDPYPSSPDASEEKVYRKLEALNRELERSEKQQAREKPKEQPPLINPLDKTDISPDVARLEAMMQSIQESPGENRELAQISQVLDKVLDVQNPERVQDRIRQQSEQNKRQVFAVQAPPDDAISLLEPRQNFSQLIDRYKADTLPKLVQAFTTPNAFYSLEDAAIETPGKRSIPAAIPENQTLVSGATLKLRLMEDIYIAGVKVPKDHFVYGQATLNGERLQISISSIEYENYILPVSLTVYDKKDGLQGIHIPGAITRDVAKRSAAQSVQGLGTLNMLDPSIGAQAVSAGLQMAQNLVSKSAKMVWVTVEAGYPVLLKDDNQKDK